MHDVAILHDVFFAFDAEFTCLTASGLATKCDIIFVLDNLSTDKTTLEVGVDDTCTLRRFATRFEGPSTYLVATCGEESAELKQRIC